MIKNNNLWRKIFPVSFGLFAGTAFCMKWMEVDFIQNGEKFSMIGLELFYPKEKIISIFSGLDEHVKSILRYHLNFDFVFMAGVFPGIASLCMMARNKSSGTFFQKILLVFALLQIAAWGFDIYENLCLLNWIKNPVIGNEFKSFQVIVIAKWIIALSAVILAIPLILKKRTP